MVETILMVLIGNVVVYVRDSMAIYVIANILYHAFSFGIDVNIGQAFLLGIVASAIRALLTGVNLDD